MFSNESLLHTVRSVTVLLIVFAVMTAIGSAADTEKAKELYNTGITSAKEGKVDDAVLAYKAAIAADPEFVNAYINLGQIQFERGELTEAQKNFKTATEKAPKDILAQSNLGKVHYALKQYVEAEQAFKAALDVESNNSDLLLDLGKVYYRKLDFPNVIESINKCHKAGGGDNVSWYMLGRGYQNEEKTAEAIEAYKKSLTMKESEDAHSALGYIYLGEENYAAAANEFRAALKSDPNAHRAAFNYAVAVQSADPEDYEKSIQAWEQYVKVAKGNPRAQKEIAQAQQVLKDLRDAKEQAELQ